MDQRTFIVSSDGTRRSTSGEADGNPRWCERGTLAKIFGLSWPISISFLAGSAVSLVEAVLIGRVGSAELAGMSLAATLAVAMLRFATGIFQGSKFLIARAVGAGDEAQARTYRTACLIMACCIGLCLAGGGRLVLAAFQQLGGSASAGLAARTYLGIRLVGVPALVIGAALREARLAGGDSRTPMIVATTATMVNIVAAIVLVAGLRRGVSGVAWAAVGSNALEAALLLPFGRMAREWNFRAVRRAHLRMVWNTGWPVAIQQCLQTGAFVVVAVIVSSISVSQMAAHHIAFQVVLLSFLPAAALGEATSVLVAQAIGTNDIARARDVTRGALLLVSAYTLTCAVVMTWGSSVIARGFTTDPELLRSAIGLLHIAAAFQVVDGVDIVVRGALRGTGDLVYPALVAIVLAWLCTPTLAWLLGAQFGLGAAGAWIGLSLEVSSSLGILWTRLQRSGWRHVH